MQFAADKFGPKGIHYLNMNVWKMQDLASHCFSRQSVVSQSVLFV